LTSGFDFKHSLDSAQIAVQPSLGHPERGELSWLFLLAGLAIPVFCLPAFLLTEQHWAQIRDSSILADGTSADDNSSDERRT
jgi:hypothetical protein